LELEEFVPELARSAVYAFGGWEVDLSRRELRLRGTPVALGSRAFEIIEVLVRADGELINKYDLMQRVWPGAIVEENTLQFHISAVRKALGADRDLLKTVSGRGYRLTGGWTSGNECDTARPEAIASRERDKPRETNLPLSAAPLVGRSTALEELAKALSLHRVVTLTGPGGIGKSVLAMETGRTVLPSFGGDCRLVELASLTDANLVPSALCRALGLRVGGDEISFEAVAQAIGRRKLLIILDNCEHVIEAVADLTETIIRRCPNTSVLATSREVLRVEGEYVYRVQPLDVPPDSVEGMSGVHEYSAVQLFLARMKTLEPELAEASREDLAAIADICRRLDGIPLAIEFAAARSVTLGVEQVGRGLDDRFRLLTGGRRTALARHQTLRGTLDWSYELLPEQERHLLRRLAIFVAGFTLDAAIHVVRDANLDASKVMEGIANLVAKSLVVVSGSLSSRRWRLLETIRAYALEKATEAGEVELAARYHAEYFQRALTPAFEGEQPKLGIHDLDGCSQEIDNVRAALDWSFSEKGNRGIGASLTAAYIPVWLHLVMMGECRDRTRQALDGLDSASLPDQRLQMYLSLGLGTSLVFMMGRVEETRSALNEALRIAESLDNADASLRALWALWMLEFNIGESHAAQHTAEQFCSIARRKDDPANTLVGDRLVGASLQYQGRQSEARPHFQRVLQVCIEMGEQPDAVWFHYDQRTLARSMLARVLWLEGHLDQAIQEADKSIEDARAAARGLSLPYTLAWTTYPIMLMTGNLDAAENATRTLLAIAARHNAAWWKTVGSCLRAKFLIKRGEFDAGVWLLQDCLRICEQTGWTVCHPEFLGALAEGLAGMGREAEALQTIDRALLHAERGGECWYVPELLRLKAELIVQASVDRSVSKAEDCLKEGLELARRQGALFWELRCALGMAQLKLKQDRAGEAREILAPVYGKFTEGFEATDLRSARTMLDRLSQACTKSQGSRASRLI
jgi:predicted ATPase/DNA-binding winged helix-turn-helix (wHTH) protein